MEEKFKVIFQISVDQIPKAIDLLRNKTNVVFNSTSIFTDEVLQNTFEHSTKVQFENCDACITNNPNSTRLHELRKRGCKIRIIK